MCEKTVTEAPPEVGLCGAAILAVVTDTKSRGTARHRVAERVSAWLKREGLTQKQLAAMYGHGKSQAWVSRNLPKIGPDTEHLDRVAEVMGTDPGELVTWRDVDFSATNLAEPTGTTQPVTDKEETERDYPPSVKEPSVMLPPYDAASDPYRQLWSLISSLTPAQAREALPVCSAWVHQVHARDSSPRAKRSRGRKAAEDG